MSLPRQRRTICLAATLLALAAPAAAQESGVLPDSLRAPEDVAGPFPEQVLAEEPTGDELLGRLTARGSYEIRTLATDSLLGGEDWALYEDASGFRTLRASASFEVGGERSSRSATVTVNPDLLFVEADLGSTAGGVEAYASFRRTGDLLTVEAFSGGSGQTRQQVRFPEDGVFASQVFATRGWELAPFDREGEETRPVYMAGSAPGILVGEFRSLRARRAGRDAVRVRAGRFNAFLFEVPLEATSPSQKEPEPAEAALDRWWVLTGSRIPAAAELASLGVRVELVELEENPEPAEAPPHGPILARGVYHHRPLRKAEPLAIETWTLSAAPGGGFVIESQVSYADGRTLAVRAVADSLFQVRELQLRRRRGREGESGALTVAAGELRAEARGGGVGDAQQRFALEGPVAFRLGVGALEGWATAAAQDLAAAGNAAAAAGSFAAGDAASARGAATAGPRVSLYWLPSGPHPLGTLVDLPPEVDLGDERVSTPARTFASRRYASPAETPPFFRSTRWVFGPYRLAARVLLSGLGEEMVLVRYETPE